MAGPAMAYAGASAGLDLLSGLFGYFASQEAAQVAESRGRMLRMEAEDEAVRYGEQARKFEARQRVAYLKSGVELSGSPLDVLAETVRTSQEDLSAIRARGRAAQAGQSEVARQTRAAGRNALLAGILGGAGKVAQASYQSGQNTKVAGQNRQNTRYTDGR